MNQLFVIDGVYVRRDQYARFCLNDLPHPAGGEERHKPGSFFTSKSAEVVRMMTVDQEDE